MSNFRGSSFPFFSFLNSETVFLIQLPLETRPLFEKNKSISIWRPLRLGTTAFTKKENYFCASLSTLRGTSVQNYRDPYRLSLWLRTTFVPISSSNKTKYSQRD